MSTWYLLKVFVLVCLIFWLFFQPFREKYGIKDEMVLPYDPVSQFLSSTFQILEKKMHGSIGRHE